MNYNTSIVSVPYCTENLSTGTSISVQQIWTTLRVYYVRPICTANMSLCTSYTFHTYEGRRSILLHSQRLAEQKCREYRKIQLDIRWFDITMVLPCTLLFSKKNKKQQMWNLMTTCMYFLLWYFDLQSCQSEAVNIHEKWGGGVLEYILIVHAQVLMWFLCVWHNILRRKNLFWTKMLNFRYPLGSLVTMYVYGKTIRVSDLNYNTPEYPSHLLYGIFVYMTGISVPHNILQISVHIQYTCLINYIAKSTWRVYSSHNYTVRHIAYMTGVPVPFKSVC